MSTVFWDKDRPFPFVLHVKRGAEIRRYVHERTCRIVEVSPGNWECDECGSGIYWDGTDRPNVSYCPGCGARVVE